MEKHKFQSMKKRADRLHKEGKSCDICEKNQAEVVYRGLHLCKDCLNPEYDPISQKVTRDYWCGLKSNWGDL